MALIIKEGDIFESKLDYLVCPVNCVGIMGNGLAKIFKNKFPDCEVDYMFACHNWIEPKMLNNIGDFYKGTLCNKVLHFATKKHWKNKSDLELIKNGLINLRAVNSLSSFAFPALGCGEGGLKWEDMKLVFEEVFMDCKNQIELYKPK